MKALMMVFQVILAAQLVQEAIVSSETVHTREVVLEVLVHLS